MTEDEKQEIRNAIENHTIYKDSRYVAWRKRIMKRDGYQCQFPGCKHRYGNLNAHHIRMKWYNPELIYKALNGISLCKRHHTYVHKKGSDKYVDQFEAIAIANGKKKRIIRPKTVKPRGKSKRRRKPRKA